MQDNATKEYQKDQLEFMPDALLRMFMELGQDAAKELQDRAIKTWENAINKQIKITWDNKKIPTAVGDGLNDVNTKEILDHYLDRFEDAWEELSRK